LRTSVGSVCLRMFGVKGDDALEVVYEFTPEPSPVPFGVRDGNSSSASKASHAASPGASGDGLDTSSAPVKDAFGTFAKREAGPSASSSSRPRSEYEALGSTPGLRGFEPPEQRLARLQAEVADLLRLAESPVMHSGGAAAQEASELLGGEPASVAAELRVLEQRLGSLARDGPPAWRGVQPDGSGGGAEASAGPMPQALKARIERLAAGSGGGALPAAAGAAPSSGSDGRLTYEISYSPSPATLADSSRIATLENSIAEIERRLGVLDPASPIADLQTAVSQMQKRLSLLDTNKIDAISRRVHVVMSEVDNMLLKKGDLGEGGGADHNLDQKVRELYEFCHRWSSTAASLPAIVARLQSLQALHHQSASFVSRLTSLEQQQDELARLLETTNSAVVELGKSLQENMSTVMDNMKTLEAKISKVKT